MAPIKRPVYPPLLKWLILTVSNTESATTMQYSCAYYDVKMPYAMYIIYGVITFGANLNNNNSIMNILPNPCFVGHYKWY